MPHDPERLAGKVVLDSNNREPDPLLGYTVSRLAIGSLAEQLQAAAPKARVVKAFNTIVRRLLAEEPERLKASGAQVVVAGDWSALEKLVQF